MDTSSPKSPNATSEKRKEPSYHAISQAIADKIMLELDAIGKDGDLPARVKAEVQTILEKNVVEKITKELVTDVTSDLLLRVPAVNNWEGFVENTLFRSRWIMAIGYAISIFLMVGLCFLIAVEVCSFGIQAIEKVFCHWPDDNHFESAPLVATIVDVLDLVLIGSLLVMVLIGGYENTISRINKQGHIGPSWVGNLDLSRLKIKVAASIVLISGVHLLKIFLDLRRNQDIQEKFDYNILWSIIIHIVFIFSVLLLAYVDKMLQSVDYKKDH